MRLVNIQTPSPGDGEIAPGARSTGRNVVLLFGAGLIGQAVERGLVCRAPCKSTTLPYTWHDAEQRAQDRDAILAALNASAEQDGATFSALTLVWAGGKGGFGSDTEHMDQEMALLDEVLSFMDRLWSAWPTARRSVHLMSSAGGLFEGQRHCDAHSIPAPLRPYGVGKLQQEHRLAALDPSVGVDVYRPSSVYGVSPSGRVGLITALIGNALRGQTTRIVGSAHTLRDYVAASDIGHFVAQRILRSGDDGISRDTHLLACGRSASMMEVIGHVEQKLGDKLLFNFDPRPSNARDMSFLPSALPDGWQHVDLATGIAAVAMQMRQSWAYKGVGPLHG